MKKTFLKFSFEFVPAFWPYAIYLELLENREWFAGFFHKKLTYLQSSGHHRQLKNVISNQNNEKLADTFNLALPKKKKFLNSLLGLYLHSDLMPSIWNF